MMGFFSLAYFQLYVRTFCYKRDTAGLAMPASKEGG